MQVRPADAAEIDHLARLWYDSWHKTHAPLSPPELIRLRTLGSFRDRLETALPNVSVVGPVRAPLGFCALKDDELYQLFVSSEAHRLGRRCSVDRRRGSAARPAWRGDGLARLRDRQPSRRTVLREERLAHGWHVCHCVGDVDWAFPEGTLALRKTAHPLNVSISFEVRRLP